jgi:uncharacterized protein YdaU (DUF1376 family)
MNYYKRHIGDYAAATRHLTMVEHGAYSMLLDVYYLSESPLPSDTKQTARKAGARTADEIAAVEAILAEFFTLTPGGWIQGRCDREIADYQRRVETNTELGRRGGRPKSGKETDSVSAGNPIGSDTETEPVPKNNRIETLTNNQEPLTNNQKIKTNAREARLDLSTWPTEPSQDLLADWIAHRKRKRAVITPRVLAAMAPKLRQAEELGYSVDQVLTTIIERNWQGFEPEWLEPRRATGRGPPGAQPSKQVQAMQSLMEMRHEFGLDGGRSDQGNREALRPLPRIGASGGNAPGDDIDMAGSDQLPRGVV